MRLSVMDTRCPSCDTPLGLFPPREALRHVNACLDADEIAAHAKSDTDENRDGSVVIDAAPVCGICQRNLSELSHSARLAHGNRCADAAVVAQRVRQLRRSRGRRKRHNAADAPKAELCPAVARLLQLVGLQRYSQRFIEHEIDLDVLQNLGVDDWPILRLPENAQRRIQDALVDAHLLRKLATSALDRNQSMISEKENIPKIDDEYLLSSAPAAITMNTAKERDNEAGEFSDLEEISAVPHTQPLGSSILGKQMCPPRRLLPTQEDNDNSIIADTPSLLRTGDNINVWAPRNLELVCSGAHPHSGQNQRRGYTQLEELIKEAEEVAVDANIISDGERLMETPRPSSVKACIQVAHENWQNLHTKYSANVVIDLDVASNTTDGEPSVHGGDSARRDGAVGNVACNKNPIKIFHDESCNLAPISLSQPLPVEQGLINDTFPTSNMAQLVTENATEMDPLTNTCAGLPALESDIHWESTRAIKIVDVTRHCSSRSSANSSPARISKDHKKAYVSVDQAATESRCPVSNLLNIELWYETHCEKERIRHKSKMRRLRREYEGARRHVESRNSNCLNSDNRTDDEQLASTVETEDAVCFARAVEPVTTIDDDCDLFRGKQRNLTESADSAEDEELVRTRIGKLSSRGKDDDDSQKRAVSEDESESDVLDLTQDCFDEEDETHGGTNENVTNNHVTGKGTKTKGGKHSKKSASRTKVSDEIVLDVIRKNHELHDKMLLMEPVRFEDVSKTLTDAGVRIGVSRLTDFLDRQGISYKSVYKDLTRGRKDYLRHLNSQN